MKTDRELLMRRFKSFQQFVNENEINPMIFDRDNTRDIEVAMGIGFLVMSGIREVYIDCRKNLNDFIEFIESVSQSDTDYELKIQLNGSNTTIGYLRAVEWFKKNPNVWL